MMCRHHQTARNILHQLDKTGCSSSSNVDYYHLDTILVDIRLLVFSGRLVHLSELKLTFIYGLQIKNIPGQLVYLQSVHRPPLFVHELAATLHMPKVNANFISVFRCYFINGVCQNVRYHIVRSHDVPKRRISSGIRD